MQVRLSTWCGLAGALLVLGLGSALVFGAGCAYDPDENSREDAGGGGDGPNARRPGSGGGASAADASASTDASVPMAKPGADAGADAGTAITTITAVATAASCSGELPLPPAPSCPLADGYEPNSGDRFTVIKLDPTCSIAQANLTEDDVDRYRFEASTSDPVLVELAYARRGDTALDFKVEKLTGGNETTTVTTSEEGPLQSSVAERAHFEAQAGTTYDVSVRGKLGELCQPYTLRVNPRYCTDEFEDNETPEDAAKLDLGSTGARELQASVYGADEDYYRFSTPKADPFLITGSYTVDESSESTIGVRVSNAMGSTIASAGNKRTGPSETWSQWARSEAAGSLYHLRVSLWPSAGDCAPYTLKVDTAACTDSFEDNDTLDTPAKLPIGSDQQATTFSGDLDHYDVSSLASGGTCVVTATTVAGGTGKLRAQMSDASGVTRESASSEAVGNNQVVTLRWLDVNAKTLRVSGDDELCQPYTLRCTLGSPPD